jgi:hypothetical protein
MIQEPAYDPPPILYLSPGRLARGLLAIMTINFAIRLCVLSILPAMLIPGIKLAKFLEITFPENTESQLTYAGFASVTILYLLIISFPLQVTFWIARNILINNGTRFIFAIIIALTFEVCMLCIGIVSFGFDQFMVLSCTIVIVSDYVVTKIRNYLDRSN